MPKKNRKLPSVTDRIRDMRRADIEGAKQANKTTLTFDEPAHQGVNKIKSGKRKNTTKKV